MFTLPIGLILSALILFLSVDRSSLDLFMQPHAFFLVIGGSLAVFVLGTPWRVICNVFSSMRLLLDGEGVLVDHLRLFMSISKDHKKALESKHALIHYAGQLWEQGTEPDLFIALLSQKRTAIESELIDAIQAVKNAAKYPPALGMAGTVIGMIQLFSRLDGHKKEIGSSLAIAMTATFYGLILTNLVLSPLADRLHVKHLRNSRLNSDIYQVLLLVHRGHPTSLIEDEVMHRAA